MLVENLDVGLSYFCKTEAVGAKTEENLVDEFDL